ncbi:uncharacterized protein LOC104454245 [Eucalyptus grandis]|uniref:Uncharacterized protein n=1 Tax=Eucalyptus globulus TaxID=34317 RepID=A0ABD3JVS2_EUCGL|nr:uncharacterized protein LOC104454245 [Eucalyptus grandis]XP_010067341.2 uncharacterized protein LOC104454245 [Eucalyptus grandis]XP_010067343.2 uncharacterized protein LOC104454245 [Eucalyptus grandis]
MHGFSTVDGFVEITESLAEMIKYVANEPSVGLFYILQHTQNAVPNVISLKNNVAGRSQAINLHTEDLEDSITMMRSMKDCGFPIVDDMIGDINKSLAIVSAKQPKRGLIHSQTSGFEMRRISSSGPTTWGRSTFFDPQDGERSGNYFSNVLKSAKQKASNFKWSNLDSQRPIQTQGEKHFIYTDGPLAVGETSSSSTLPVVESDELPLSSEVSEELQEEKEGESHTTLHLPSDNLLTVPEDFESFRANREAKLEEWLGETGHHNNCNGATNGEPA